MNSIRWAFNVRNWKPTRDQWKFAIECVDKEERERCYRFVFVDDCKLSMVGRLLMRKAASESLGLQYDHVSFSRSDSGKPYLLGKHAISFNISHHGDFCVLASEKSFNVGVDVMKIEHRGKSSVAEFFSHMEEQFSSYEWNFINQPGLERDQLARFYRLWCLKESYVKAIGTGIVVDLQSLSFSCQTQMLRENVITSDTKLYNSGKLTLEWKFEETMLDSNHCVAVALSHLQEDPKEANDKNFPEKNFHLMSFAELMENSKSFNVAEGTFWEDFLHKDEKKLV